MQISSLKWWLFLLWMIRIEGSHKPWKPNESIVNHRIMKMILESCYEDESLSNPIVVIGNFRESIDKLPVISVNEFYNSDEEIQYTTPLGKISYVANKIILIEDSPKKLQSDLTLLQSTRWWDHMALFFIIEKNAGTCENFMDMLIITWRMNILNSIYICTDSNNKTALYTFNPIANYAPSPWKRREELEYLHIFHQMFDSNIVCENLHYDKTKILDGYEITVIVNTADLPYSVPRRTYFSVLNEDLKGWPSYVLLHGIFTSWDVNARLETAKNPHEMLNRLEDGTAEMSLKCFSYGPDTKLLITNHFWFENIVIEEIGREVSTFTKIRQSWSSSVVIVAATALSTLLIILTIQNRSFPLAVLDLIRLLTHKAIPTINGSHKFRIYFTTILIFIVITNGVFQGFIVTFLIKPERVSPSRTDEEFLGLGFEIYFERTNFHLMRDLCPKCDIGKNYLINCIKSTRNEAHHACLLRHLAYRSISDALNWDFVEKPVFSHPQFFINRPNWPLRNCISKRFSRIFESGLQNFWMRTFGIEQKRSENEARKAEWSSPQYKPLKLRELTFAFQVLVLGLSISTIIFFMELIVAKCRKSSKLNLGIRRLNRPRNGTG